MKGTDGMECDRIRDLLSDYLEDGLDAGDRDVVAAHLGACARCAAEARGLSETIALLASLPRETAPPELLDRVMDGIERESARRPGRGRVVSPRRARIPVEAAAAVFLLVLVYAIQRGMPARPVLRAGEGGAPATTAGPVRDVLPAVPIASRAAPPESRAAGPAPAAAKADSPVAVVDADGAASARYAVPSYPAARALPVSQLPPSVTAARVSSAEEAIEPKVFAAPPSRMLKALPFGREVTLEVASGDREGIEERIVAAAERLGGAGHPGPARGADGAQPLRSAAVRVHLPAASAGAFLEALKGLGTIPPEGMPAAVDLPAGPTPGLAAYTVRIRVR
ncbi:MAG: zf-HC2 domain-containing protein [Gemmatimonadota bacterium]